MAQLLSANADLARKAIEERAFGGAKPFIEDLGEQYPDDASVAAFRALTRIWTGDYEGAQSLLDAELAKRPHASLYGVYAELCLFRDQKEEAASFIRQGTELNPDDFLVLRAAVSEAAAAKRLDEAEMHLNRCLANYPGDAESWAAQFTLLQGRGDLDGCQILIDESPDWFKTSHELALLRGRLAFSRHDMTTMEQWFQEAVARRPEDAGAWRYLAIAQSHQGKYQDAERSASFAIEINPRDPLALRVLAKVAKAKGDMTAEAAFEKRAKEAIPVFRQLGTSQRAIEAMRRGRVDEALRLFREVEASDQKVIADGASKSILNLFVNQGRWREAREQLEKVDRQGFMHPLVDLYRSQILFHEGKRQEALDLVRHLHKSPEPLAEVLPTAFGLLWEAGEYDEARQVLTCIQDDLPGHPMPIAGLIIKLEKLGCHDEARTLHEAASRKFRDDPNLKLIGLGYRAKGGDVKGALREMADLPATHRPRIRVPLKVVLKILAKRLLRRLKSGKR